MIFIMIVVTIIGIFTAINYFLIYTLGFLYLNSSGSANAQLPGLLYVMFTCTFPIGYSTGDFQALQLIVLVAFGALD